MATTTIKSTDKIKLLDQMLEDIAGDEYEDFDFESHNAAENSMEAGVKRYNDAEELDIIDIMH